MTDMLMDGTITKEVFDEKMLEFTRKLHILEGKVRIARNKYFQMIE